MRKSNISVMLHWEDEKRKTQYELINTNDYGFEIVSFSHHAIWETDYTSVIKKYKTELENLSNRFISFHGPFTDIIPHSEVKSISEIAKNRIQESINIALELNSNRIVFHTGINTIITDPNFKINTINRQIDFWSEICNKNKNIEVVIENMWEKDPEYISSICKNVNVENFGMCLDIGHINVYSQEKPEKWIEVLKKYIKHIHLNDNLGIWDEHLSLGKGNIDLKTWMTNLVKIENIQYVLELIDLDDIKSSLKKVEEFL